MKKACTSITILFLCISCAQANSNCSKTGTTVVFVNGMNAESEEAIEAQKEALKNKYFKINPLDKNILFRYAYNPSRGEGMDLVKSIMQSCSASNDVGDIDLLDMLNQLNERITTERVVFVGHSQGTLYTNALYNRVNAQQLPTQSLGLINIATPSHYIPGGGSYLTSTNDTVINAARSAQFSCLRGALPANIDIPYTDIDPAGHKFTEVYLEHAGAQIVRSIHDTIQRLSVDTISRPKCIDPEIAISWEKTKRVALAVSAPMVNGTYHSVKGVSAFSTTTLDMTTYAANRGADQLIALGNATITAAQFAYNTSRSIVSTSMNLASSILFTSPAITQSSAVALAVAPVSSVHAVPTPQLVTFESLPESPQPASVIQPTAPEEDITWEYIPERDASYIPAVIEPQPQTPQVVSTPVTAAAPGGLDTLLQSPQPIILTGGAGQGGGAPVIESMTGAAAPAPLTCAPGEVLSSDGASCVIPDIVCSPPEVRDATTNTCVTQDTTPPTFTVNLTGCLSQELSGENFKCHAHTDAVVSASFVVETGSAIAVDGTLVTEPSITVARDTVLTATDAAGNTTTYSITLIREELPILISEVGYPLDAPQDGMHQYIELYNPTEHTITLDGLSLQSSIMTGDPLTPQFVLPLSGSIPPRSFFLSTNNYDITDTREDMTSVWPNLLTNSGATSHQLLLKQGSITLDSFELGCPSLSTTCHPTGHPFALERSARRGNAVDYAYSLEQNNSQFVFTADTVRFVGSPGKRNTANYIVATLQDTLSKMYTPYYSHALEIPTGATASIDPGVTLTVKEGGGINIYGTLTVNGTELEPVIVESAGRWGGVSVSAGATLTASHMHIRNAGIGNSGSDNAALKNRGGIVMLSNVTLLNVQPNGFFQDDGTATLTNVSMTTDNYPESGVKVRGGTFTYSGGVLSNFSDFGFHITGTPTCTISDITITGVRSARTNGSETLCAWSNVTHNGSPL